jgi:DNA replication protein DnaC
MNQSYNDLAWRGNLTPSKEDLEYIQRFYADQRMDDVRPPSLVVEPDMEKWNNFDADHYQLKNARRMLATWYNNYFVNGNKAVRGIILAGNCGSGKTHLAQAIRDMHKLRVIYWPEIDLIGAIQNSFNNRQARSKDEIIGEIRRTELFIFDDLGAYETKGKEETEAWMRSIYLDLFDWRCDQGKPLLITTNLTRAEIFPRVGERVASRILGAINEKAYYVDMFNVPDYRLKNYE